MLKYDVRVLLLCQ